MKTKIITLVLVLFCFNLTFSQKKITITANFPDAEFFKMQGTTVLRPALGVGSIELKLDKKDLNRIIVMKKGYEPLIQEYLRTRKWTKNIQVVLENRIVVLTTEPYDANIYVKGRTLEQKAKKS